MQKNIPITVIVPIHNTEKYLSKCIESLLGQTYSNIEILLVDDGSTDSSYEIARSFTLKDARIKLFKKPNGGVSSARNLGLEKATGEYILFVDSDDAVNPIFIEKMVRLSRPTKMIICGFSEDKGKCSKKRIYKKTKIPENKFRFLMYAHNSIGGFCCNKIYSRKIIKKYCINFDEEAKICEDMLFNIKYCRYIKAFRYVPLALYHYRQHDKNATRTNRKKLNDEILKTISTMRQLPANHQSDKDALDYMELEANVSNVATIGLKAITRYAANPHIPLTRKAKTIAKYCAYSFCRTMRERA